MLAEIEPGPVAVGVTLFLLLVAFCFVDRRVDRSLAVLALYLGLLDGYLKLRTGSPLTTLGRDVLVLAIAGGALLRTMTSRNRLPVPPLGAFVLSFSGVVVVEMFNPLGPEVPVSAAGLRQHLEFVPLFFLGYAFLRRKSQIRTLLVILVACASIGGVVSYIQSTTTPQQFAEWGPGYRERIEGTGPFAGAPRLSYEDGGVTRVRPFGLGSDIGAGALVAALAFPALVALMMGPQARLRLAMIPLAAGIALAVATSGTRQAIIVFMVCAFAFALLAATSRLAVRVVAGLAVGVLVVYGAFTVLGSDSSTAKRSQNIAPDRVASTYFSERGDSLGRLPEYALRYPLGRGVGSVGPAAAALTERTPSSARFDAETQWNMLVLETGIFGFVLLLGLHFRLMWISVTRIRHIGDQQVRLQLAALAAPLFGLIAAGFSGPTTISVPQAPYFWLVAGVLSYWLITAYRRTGRTAPVPDRFTTSSAPDAGTRAFKREPVRNAH